MSEEEISPYSEEQQNRLFKAIYIGAVNVLKLPRKLYNAIGEKLTEGVYKGFGKSILEIKYNDPDIVFLHELRTNTYIFSAAKTFNYVLATESLLIENDKVLPFKDFKERAKIVYEKYNETWLRAEYDTAIGQAQSARAWRDFDQTKLLQYQTVHDSHVSEICRALDGIIRPAKDPFWNVHGPKNHYNCRCLLRELTEGKETTIPNDLPKVPIEFAFNPGKEAKIYDKNHPYFTEIPTEFKKLAKKNFNLPIPK